jgi:hypothetical protein
MTTWVMWVSVSVKRGNENCENLSIGNQILYIYIYVAIQIKVMWIVMHNVFNMQDRGTSIEAIDGADGASDSYSGG